MLYPHLAPRPKFAAEAALLPGSILAAGGLLSLWAFLKRGREGVVALLCLTACLTAVATPPVIFAGSIERKSTRELAPLIKERFSGVPIVSYGYYRQDVPFYTGRRVIVAGNSGELEFGRLLEKEKGWFVDPPTFCRMWDSSSPLAVLMGRGDLPLFQSVVRTPARTVAEWGGTVLISNR